MDYRLEFVITSFQESLQINSIMKKTLLLPLFFLAFFISSCDKDESVVSQIPEKTTGTVEIRFIPTMNGEAFSVNQNFVGPNGLRMRYETFKFYLSDIQLQNGSTVLGSKDVVLVDFSLSDKTISIETTPGTIDQLTFGMGVKQSLNGTADPDFNPASYPIDHPLSVYAGMYWTWASGYIFSKLEGRIDTSAAQNLDPTYSFFYHSGKDTLFSTHSISNINAEVVKGQKTSINLKIEVNDVFKTSSDTINMVQDYFTHTTDDFDLAKKVINNLGDAIRKQ
jgi:hypothetical protein